MTQTLDEIMAPANNLSIGGNRAINLADPLEGTDAINLQTADAKYLTATTRLDEMSVPQLPVNMGSQQIINLGNATELGHAINLN